MGDVYAQWLAGQRAPASSTAALVTLTAYDNAGNAFESTDPDGTVTHSDFDDAGRTIRTIQNYQPGPLVISPGPANPTATANCDSGCSCGVGTCTCPPPPGNTENITVETTYNADGLVTFLTAKNPTTGDQATQYQYGTTLATSSIARNDLLVSTIYPDSQDMYDVVSQTYNRQGQPTTKQDQNGTVHAYSYDLLGRRTSDSITTLAAGVDPSVQQIATAYSIQGLVQLLTSEDGYGNVVNQVQNVYNGFAQLVTQYQEHGGSVVTSSSLAVQYGYASGSANTIRPTGITYPNGRQLNYTYNAGNDAALGRISSIGDSSFATLVVYTYLGLGSFVQADYQQPGVRWDLINGACGGSSSSVATSSSSASSNTETIETYAGLDPFGRVINNLWCKYSTPSGAVDQIQYGYDLSGNRLWRKNVVAATGFDELYAYDGAERLSDFSRGTLNQQNNISSLALKQEWQLDATGNWSRFQNFDMTGATPALDQQRTSDNFNEITDIAATVGPTWVTPQYDRNGNMILMPQPDAPTASFTAVYDAWNRLIALSNGGLLVAQYVYDAQNWRMRKIVSGQTRDYYYTAGWQSIEERVSAASWASGSVSGSTSAPQVDRQFVWGLRYIDDLVLRDRNPSGSGSGSGSLSEASTPCRTPIGTSTPSSTPPAPSRNAMPTPPTASSASSPPASGREPLRCTIGRRCTRGIAGIKKSECLTYGEGRI